MAERQRTLPPDLLAEWRKQQAAEAKKPRFIPKKERERMAQEKRAKEEAEAKQREEQERAKAQQRREADRPRNGTASWNSSGRPIPTGPQAHLNARDGHDANGSNGYGGHRSRGTKRGADNADAREAEERLAKLQQRDEAERRARYMGPEVNKSTFSAKKKRQRTTANKFNFDWDPEDDTSRPVERWKAEPSPLFPSTKPLAQMTRQEAEQHAEKLRREWGDAGDEHYKDTMLRWESIKRQEEKAKVLWQHWSEKKLEDMRPRDWRIFKDNFDISTKGGSIPNPMRSWRESALPRRLLDIVADVGYEDPSPIQRAAIPIALQARDLIGVAVTGSGKTAAFLLPLLVYISELPGLTEYTKNDGPYALILAPTRELVQQIESEAKKFATPLGFTVVSIVGGHSLEEQAFALRNGAEIIVATPGRLVDCLERRLLVFTQCCYIIMDEADRMIDQGFEEPLTKILDAMPVTNEKPDTDEAENAQLMSRYLGSKDRYRQTMMYTATMPPTVEKIATKYLRRPAIVTIGTAGEAVETVEQRVEFVSGEDKRKRRLQEILQSGQFKPPVIVFVNIKRNCDMVARDIKSMGFSAVTLHGSKTQEQREAALASVRRGETQVLVATDLAGRGIDVVDVSLVVNFNMATNIESYTHRIGRTGRAGKSGVAITFLGPEDNDVLYDLRQIISKSSISKVPEELRRHDAAQTKPTRGGGGRKGAEDGNQRHITQ